MLQPRTVKLKRAKQGAKRAARVGFHLEQGTTVWACGTRVEKCIDLLLQQVSLKGAEKLEDVSEVLVCYSPGMYESQSNPQRNRVTR